ncbi:PhzF family phenazine biosynthesis protein, partial [Klebsiella pneumoniae]
IDNGPGWLGLQLRDARTVLDLEPDFAAMRGLELGVIGAHDAAEAERIGATQELRAFCPELRVPVDPVTGSLNAGFAVWLVSEGVLPA